MPTAFHLEWSVPPLARRADGVDHTFDVFSGIRAEARLEHRGSEVRDPWVTRTTSLPATVVSTMLEVRGVGVISPAGIEAMFEEQAGCFANLDGQPPDPAYLAALGERFGVAVAVIAVAAALSAGRAMNAKGQRPNGSPTHCAGTSPWTR